MKKAKKDEGRQEEQRGIKISIKRNEEEKERI